MTSSQKLASFQQRIRHFLINALSFSLCYQVANSVAQANNITRHIAFSFESHIPFLEWMILPYLSSGIFFCWSFFQVKTADSLRALSQRLLFATVIASLFFVLYPLQFSLIRPDIQSPIFAVLFKYLSTVDKPYNQLPSLHIAYCLIIWQSLNPTYTHKLSRALLSLSLLLVAASTLFTYQHHLMDIVGGLLLGLSAIRLSPLHVVEARVAFYYAMAAIMIFAVGVIAWHCWPISYLSISLLLVSFAYQRQQRNFLNKRKGKHSLLTWILYAPYLTGYWLTWYLVQHRERHAPAFVRVSQHLWTGRRLNVRQAQELPTPCVVVDLCCELSETPLLLLPANAYRHFPLMDLIIPDLQTKEEIATFIRQEIKKGNIVYLHCAMGYSRSKLLAEYTLSGLTQ